MKTIEEINEIAPYDPLEWQQGYGIWQAGYMEGQKNGATEQKDIYEKRIAELESFAERATKLIEAEKAFREHLETKEKKLIDFACELLESYFRDIENPDFYSKRYHPTDLESMYHWTVKELVDDFRKAMEE